MFILLGDTAFVCASVPPAQKATPGSGKGALAVVFSLCQRNQPCSPQCRRKQLELPAHRELPRRPVGLRLGMDCSFPLPWTEAGEEFGSKQVALSSSWPMSPQQGGFWGQLQWGAVLWERCMRCLEQSVGTGILSGGTLSWRMLHPRCPLTWAALFLHGGRNPKPN